MMHDPVCQSIQLLQTSEDRATQKQAIKQLGQIGIGREDAINALVEVVRLTPDEPTRWLAIENLSQIATGDSNAVDTLVELLPTSRPPTQQLIAKYLLLMLDNNPSAVTAIANIAHTTKDEVTRQAVAAILGKVNTNNSAAIDALVSLAYNSSTDETLMRVIYALRQLKANSNNVILAELYLIRNDSIQAAAIGALREIVLDPEIIKAISALQERYMWRMSGVAILMGLLSLIKFPFMREFYILAEKAIQKIILISTREIKILKKRLDLGENILECYLIATVLGEMGLATNETLNKVLEILQQDQHPAFRTFGYYSLARMTISNLASQEKLIELQSTAKHEEERQSITFALTEAEKLKTEILQMHGQV